MGIILCPTRGGTASHNTQDKAITLAKERGDSLLFLYIVNLHFLDKLAAPIVVDVEDEVHQMGEFLLLIAKERAEEQGVETRTISRKGEVRDEIKKVAQEEKVSLVMFGRPAGDESTFELADLKTFAAEIEKETGIETIIV
jgi:nucleotide-binding universal stress UspA family protein